MSVAKVMVILSFTTIVHLYNDTTNAELLRSYDGKTEVSQDCIFWWWSRLDFKQRLRDMEFILYGKEVSGQSSNWHNSHLLIHKELVLSDIQSVLNCLFLIWKCTTLNPNWHEAGHFHPLPACLFNFKKTFFFIGIYISSSWQMDKAVSYGAEGLWFDPCLGQSSDFDDM